MSLVPHFSRRFREKEGFLKKLSILSEIFFFRRFIRSMRHSIYTRLRIFLLSLAIALTATTLIAGDNSINRQNERISEELATDSKADKTSEKFKCGQYFFQKLNNDQPLLLNAIDAHLEIIGLEDYKSEKILPG